MLCQYVDFVNGSKYVQVFFIPYLYICIVVGDPIITVGGLGNRPIITLPEIVANEDSKLFNAMILLMKCYFYFSRPYSNPRDRHARCYSSHLFFPFSIQDLNLKWHMTWSFPILMEFLTITV
jgi:hypothetical protein